MTVNDLLQVIPADQLKIVDQTKGDIHTPGNGTTFPAYVRNKTVLQLIPRTTWAKALYVEGLDEDPFIEVRI